MATLQFPDTVWRVGFYHGDLRPSLARYSPNFELLTTGISIENLKFGLYVPSPKPYLMMVSNKITGPTNPDYNTMLSITSEDTNLNNRLLEEFLKSTELPLTRLPHPNFIGNSKSGMGLCFSVFKRHGNRAMQVLRQLG